MKDYLIEYHVHNYGDSLHCEWIEPTSDFVEEMFYNGQLFHNVNISKNGKYQMAITLEDDGGFKINAMYRYEGWVFYGEYEN